MFRKGIIDLVPQQSSVKRRAEEEKDRMREKLIKREEIEKKDEEIRSENMQKRNEERRK
jgi:hypothetical protein